VVNATPTTAARVTRALRRVWPAPARLGSTINGDAITVTHPICGSQEANEKSIAAMRLISELSGVPYVPARAVIHGELVRITFVPETSAEPEPDLSAEDRGRWYSARTLAELGELVAQWLEGQIATLTGNRANTGPDEETTGLIPALAQLNRLGYVTTSSQPGWPAPSGRQRAAVEGFADDATLRWLASVVDGTGFKLIHHAVGVAGSLRPGVAATEASDGTPCTEFGRQLDETWIAAIFPDCHPDVLALLALNDWTADPTRRTWQVTIYDPQWGASDMFAVLHRAANMYRGRSAPKK
jgi:hypothetical protein